MDMEAFLTVAREEYVDITTIVPYYQALTEFLRCPSRCG
jgi:hypothetical protein